VDVSHALAPIAARLNLRDYYTVSIYYRLFIASMFPQYHKAIYLDADIAVNGDVSGLYNIPLGQRLVGAVSDAIIAANRDFRLYAEEAVGVPYRSYFNSGVLLMNLDQFRIQSIEEKFIYLLRTYHFNTVCPDQDYLNVLCHGKVLYLDKGWNKMSIDENYGGVPNLVHYNMFYKPWLYRKVAYSDYFWKYAKKTPFYGELRELQRGFGLKGRIGHKQAHLRLHTTTRAIREEAGNFKRVLSAMPIEKMPWVREVDHEA
jgi:lipopolysaccharide biosynthesis glycosyltransferase